MSRAFVGLYYTYSPPVADFIARHDIVRMVVRWILLPLVGVSWMSLYLGLIPRLLIMFLLLSLIGITSVFFFKKIRLREYKS